MNDSAEIWKGVLAGRPLAVAGVAAVPVPAGYAGIVLRAPCDAPRETLGPWWTLTDRAVRLLGEPPPLVSQAKQQVVELGRRLLGDTPSSRRSLETHVEIYNRLARGRSIALVLDVVEQADEASLDALEEVLRRKGWLQAALVLGFRSRDLDARSRRLVELVQAAGGSFVTVSEEEPPLPDVHSLPPAVLSVLRAAAVIGPSFELELLARLCGMDPLDLLFSLQQAVDLGVAVTDRGGGVLSLGPSASEGLVASTLPSLREELHRRAAELTEGSAAPDRLPVPAAVAAAPPPAAPVAVAGVEAPVDVVQLTAPPPAPAPASVREREPSLSRPASEADAEDEPMLAAAPLRPPPGATTEPQRSPRPERAAEHRVRSGDPALAVEQLLLAARSAARQGVHRHAEALAHKALALLERMPQSPEQRALEVRALLEVGRIRLEGFAPGGSFELDGAIEVLDAAKQATDEPHALCEAARLLAAAHYEKGDLPSLERALSELTDVSRQLLERGEAPLAACLLNDQAAIYLRMGDPVRAMALAEQSRAVFSRADQADPVARRELAQTDLLIARIILHVPARPGREADALSAAADHALAAVRVFEKLGEPFELARALETLGRLELRRGRLDRAIEQLRSALSEQERLSDVIGLARTTGALSEALAKTGRMDDALALLRESVELNSTKGSAVGVAFNRRAFAELTRSPPDRSRAAMVAELESRLVAAEELLGAVVLPGER